MKYKNVKWNRLTRWLGMAGCYLAVVLVMALGWTVQQLPDVIFVEKGQSLSFGQMPYVQVQQKAGTQDVSRAVPTHSGNTQLSLGGVLPLKTVRTVVTDRPVVRVCGTPFGIKMFSDGALVVAFSDIETPHGRANPAKAAGLRLGDWIVRVGSESVHSNKELSAALQKVGGLAVEVTYQRDGVTGTTTMTPIQDEDDRWKAGMWVRDSSAGVGTLTFVDENKGIFGGLGHPISDSDTGESIALRTGEIVPCTIVGHTKGKVGEPGELKGRFSSGLAIGTIRKNSACGIYGTVRQKFDGEYMPVAFCQEVHTGPAEILTTIDGDTPARYAVDIERISYQASGDKHNLVLRVTDPTLLEATGGIVQGMSGSPIIQDGKLVGAVTHVLVNDPTKGYGIFIENMLNAAA